MTTASFLRPERGQRGPQRLFNNCVALLLLLMAGCAQTPPAPSGPVVDPSTVTPPPVAVVSPANPAVVSPPMIPPLPGAPNSVESAAGNVAPSRGQPSAREVATVAAVTPAGTTRYECVKGPSGAESRRAITFPENSGRICARFPAMGPCQYERQACRASGGRVIRFDGIEITTEVEREYDKQVQRFRLNAG